MKSEWIDGKVVKWLAIEVSGDGRPPRKVWLPSHVEARVEWLWGPKGSGFAVAVIQGARGDTLEALDLRRGRTLRSEMISRPERAEAHPKD